MTDEKSKNLQDSGLVDWQVFSELIAMDEDEEGFSEGLFQTFVDQFEDTFKELDENMKEGNLEKISSLGHYLKGSAAALGLTKIAEQCERIQNYGHKDNFDDFEVDEQKDGNDKWLAFIKDALQKARVDFDASRKALNQYFDDEL